MPKKNWDKGVIKLFGSKQARKLLRELTIQLPIAVRYNSPYSAQDYREHIVIASLLNESAESLCEEPSSDALLHNTRLGLETLYAMAEAIIERQIDVARSNEAFRAPVDIAMDFFCAPYYGKKRGGWVVGGKHKDGTNYFHSWLMADSVIHGERFCLGFVPRSLWRRKHELVEELVLRILSLRIPIGTVLMDREFPGFEVLEVLMRYGLNFIAAVKDDARIKRVKNAFRRSPNSAAAIPYELRHRGRTLNVNLMLVKDGDKVYSWLTNMDRDPREIADKYSWRWGTETNNRERNKYRARTTSNRYELRYLYFMLSVALHNIWVLINMIISMRLLGFSAAPLLRSYEFKRISLAHLRPPCAE